MMEELPVEYLIQGETKESKCGEVFRSILGKYSLLCSYCYVSFSCLAEFSHHIEEHYNLIGIPSLNESSDTIETYDLKNENLIKNKPQEESCDNLEDKSSIKNIKQERRKIINKNSPLLKRIPTKKQSIRIKLITTDQNLTTETRKIVKDENVTTETRQIGNHNSKPKIKITTKKQKDGRGGRRDRINMEVNQTGEWICDICKKVFTTKYNVGYHIMSVHYRSSDLTPFLCDLCGKSFARKSLLNRHSTVHTGIKRFSCVICNQAFTEADKVIHKGNTCLFLLQITFFLF